MKRSDFMPTYHQALMHINSMHIAKFKIQILKKVTFRTLDRSLYLSFHHHLLQTLCVDCLNNTYISIIRSTAYIKKSVQESKNDYIKFVN